MFIKTRTGLANIFEKKYEEVTDNQDVYEVCVLGAILTKGKVENPDYKKLAEEYYVETTKIEVDPKYNDPIFVLLETYRLQLPEDETGKFSNIEKTNDGKYMMLIKKTYTDTSPMTINFDKEGKILTDPGKNYTTIIFENNEYQVTQTGTTIDVKKIGAAKQPTEQPTKPENKEVAKETPGTVTDIFETAKDDLSQTGIQQINEIIKLEDGKNITSASVKGSA